MYSKIGNVSIGSIAVLMLSMVLLPPIVFGFTGCIEVCWVMLVGVIGFLFLSFGGADWIQGTFAELDDLLSTRTCLETDGLSSLACQLSSQYNSQTQITGDNAVQVQSVGQSHLDLPVFPASLEDRKEFLNMLRRRRDKFEKQVAFWESMQDRKYHDIQIIGLTEMGQAYGMQMSMESVDVELLLEVLRATAAEYDRQIAILKEGI